MKYTINPSLKEDITLGIKELNEQGITGGFYEYKEGECSCCYGLEDVDFEINENIPNNWSGTWHSIRFTRNIEKAYKIFFIFYPIFNKYNLRIDWNGTVEKSMIINL